MAALPPLATPLAPGTEKHAGV